MLLSLSKIAATVGQRFLVVEPFPQPPVVRTRYPVVLMHGFGLLAALRRGGHLHDTAMYLRSHGVLAYAPNVAPYSTVADRSETWKQGIERILHETGAEKVNLIAQSMGGLDARYLISKLGMHEVVASLSTISTPHRGSGIANYVLRQPERVQEWLAGLCNWMGQVSVAGCTANFLKCVEQLTPEYVTGTFNPEVPDHPAVTYWSYAGVAGKDTDVPISPWLGFLNSILYRTEGPNDGFVSERSARWGEYLGRIPADHACEIGIQIFPGTDFDSNAFYVSIARKLAESGF